MGITEYTICRVSVHEDPPITSTSFWFPPTKELS
eukprot:UN06115